MEVRRSKVIAAIIVSVCVALAPVAYTQGHASKPLEGEKKDQPCPNTPAGPLM